MLVLILTVSAGVVSSSVHGTFHRHQEEVCLRGQVWLQGGGRGISDEPTPPPTPNPTQPTCSALDTRSCETTHPPTPPTCCLLPLQSDSELAQDNTRTWFNTTEEERLSLTSRPCSSPWQEVVHQLSRVWVVQNSELPVAEVSPWYKVIEAQLEQSPVEFRLFFFFSFFNKS